MVSTNNPYLVFQSSVASSVVSATPSPAPHELALRLQRHTRAPKRQPPRPPRPPNDGRADDQDWIYSWRLVVPVGSAPGEWPRASALELAEETFSSDMDNDDGLHAQVAETLMRRLEALLAPCTQQDTDWWAQMRNSYIFLNIAGAMRGHSDIGPHLLYFTFRHDGRRIATMADAERVTDVVIRYMGPARFRLRHPGRDLLERRLRPHERSEHFPPWYIDRE
jgi:hypothetical protein